MRTGSAAPKHRYQIAIRLGIFFVIAAILAIPLYSSSTAASHQGVGMSATAPAPATLEANRGSSRLWLPLIPTPLFVPSIATYESTCTTAQSDFVLGDTVCAIVTDGIAFPRRVQWVDPSGFVRQTTAITSDPQSFTFTIPNTQTSTVGNTTVDNRGTWKVNMISSRSTVVASAKFVVTDPAAASADLSISKQTSQGNQQVAAGSTSVFEISVTNGGPNAAQTVVITDVLPANTTFAGLVQTSGPTFTCTPLPAVGSPGTVTCTRATLLAGNSATFDLAYGVNPGTPAGTVISNTATVSSATADPFSGNNSSTATSTVVASGGGSPTCTLTCPEDVNVQSNTTDPNNPNQPGAVVHYDTPTTEGTCGTVTFSHCNDCFFPQGVTVVSVSETTGESCQFNVTVSAVSNAPTISCPSNKEVDANGDCSVVVNNVGTATATGGENVTIFATRSDGRPMYNCDSTGQNCVRQNPDYPFRGGNTTITWTATSHNAAGEETGNSSCIQTITVNNATEDTTAPVITCPANITRSNDSGQCSAAINVGTATATDNCDPNPDVEGTRSDGLALSDPYPRGTTTITWTATDSAGNSSSSCQQTVTVNDTEAPAITCPANMTANTGPGTCVATVNPGTATATDNCDTSPTVTGTRSDGQALNAPYPKGTTTITWTASDHASPANTSSCQQTITVEDHEDPVILCPAPIVQGNDPGTCSATVNPGQPTATDNCGSPTVTGTRSDGQALNAPYPKGTTTITWTATDDSGNDSSCTQTVTVVDNQAPTFTFTATQVMWPPNHKYRTFNMADLVASVQDNCDGTIALSSVIITKVTSDEIENGNGDGNTLKDIVIAANCKSVQLRSEREGTSNGRVYTIFFSVTDAAGNTGTGTTRVVVPHNPGETAVDSGPHYTVMSNCP
jgi:uncharacterized repeat protein (TIGR01451 family)